MKNNGVPDELIEKVYENLNPTEAEKELWEHGFFLTEDVPLFNPEGFDFPVPRMYAYAQSQIISDESTINCVIIRAPEKDWAHPFDNMIKFYCDCNVIDVEGGLVGASVYPSIVKRARELSMIKE